MLSMSSTLILHTTLASVPLCSRHENNLKIFYIYRYIYPFDLLLCWVQHPPRGGIYIKCAVSAFSLHFIIKWTNATHSHTHTYTISLCPILKTCVYLQHCIGTCGIDKFCWLQYVHITGRDRGIWKCSLMNWLDGVSHPFALVCSCSILHRDRHTWRCVSCEGMLALGMPETLLLLSPQSQAPTLAYSNRTQRECKCDWDGLEGHLSQVCLTQTKRQWN